MDPRLVPALAHLLTAIDNAYIPFALLREKRRSERVRRLASLCAWRSGEEGTTHWCGQDDELILWTYDKKEDRNEVRLPWEEVLEIAEQEGMIVDAALSYDLGLYFLPTEHPWWTVYRMTPYSRLSSIRDAWARAH